MPLMSSSPWDAEMHAHTFPEKSMSIGHLMIQLGRLSMLCARFGMQSGKT